MQHRPEHDFWMTHPDDVDYLTAADRWCRVCAKPDREHVCTTCGRRADDRYENPVAGEACLDRVHDAFYPVHPVSTAEEMALKAETRAEEAVTQDDRELWLRRAQDWWLRA